MFKVIDFLCTLLILFTKLLHMYGYAELNMYSTLQKMKCKNEKHDIGQRNNNNNMCVVVVVVVVVASDVWLYSME